MALKPLPKDKSDRSAWYAAAGMKAPGEEQDEVSGGGASAELTTPLLIGGPLAAVLILFAQALCDAVGVALGVSPLSLVGSGLTVVAGLLLLRGLGAGRPVAWLSALWSVGWALVLAVLYQHQLLAALKVLTVVCLFAALHVEAASVRWAAAGVGIALALAGMAAPAALRREAHAPDSQVAGGAIADERDGFSLTVPEGVSLFTAQTAPMDFLPDGWGGSKPRLVFATADKSFAGGLLVHNQPLGMELSNMLSALNPDSAPPSRNQKLVPDTLSDLEAQGWEIAGSHGTVMVVLARASDGRAFGLFGVSRTAALARNQQLFGSIVRGLQVKRALGE